MIELDLENEEFQTSLLLLKTSEPTKYNELVRSLVDATGQTVTWFENKFGMHPLDQPHFSEPLIFASFTVSDYFTILGHFETDCGLPTGRITLVAFWKPPYLMRRS